MYNNTENDGQLEFRPPPKGHGPCSISASTGYTRRTQALPLSRRHLRHIIDFRCHPAQQIQHSTQFPCPTCAQVVASAATASSLNNSRLVLPPPDESEISAPNHSPSITETSIFAPSLGALGRLFPPESLLSRRLFLPSPPPPPPRPPGARPPLLGRTNRRKKTLASRDNRCRGCGTRSTEARMRGARAAVAEGDASRRASTEPAATSCCPAWSEGHKCFGVAACCSGCTRGSE